jgi:hypothetical protein
MKWYAIRKVVCIRRPVYTDMGECSLPIVVVRPLLPVGTSLDDMFSCATVRLLLGKGIV